MADDASARGLLSEMQSRLGRDPYEALGLAGSPTPAEVRHAFLTLTKQFHPAKFARMAPDIQRLANEVFLALRAAHDHLSRPSVAPTNRQSGTLPTLRQAPSTASASGTQPRLPTTPPRPTTGQAPVAPRAAPATTPAKPAAPSSQQATQPLRPGGARLAQPSPPPQPAAPPARPTTTAAAVSTAGGADRDLAPILELFKLGQVAAARVALETLTTRVPNVPRYQSLLHYARGREAQLAKRLDEARVELQDALQIDPELAMAKTALAELFTRRK